MKKTILAILLLAQTIGAIAAVGSLTNNGNMPVNVVMYNSNYTAATSTISAKGRISAQGLIIPAGQNVDFITGTTSIDIFYGNGSQPPLHATITTNNSYTINPGSPTWSITQDQN
jgi:hypothetical protein